MFCHSEVFAYTDKHLSFLYTLLWHMFYPSSFALVSLHHSAHCHSSRRGRCLTVCYPIVRAHLTYHTHMIVRTEPLLPIHHFFQHHVLEMLYVHLVNAGGRWETEVVRKRLGETSQQPTPEYLLYLQRTHP